MFHSAMDNRKAEKTLAYPRPEPQDAFGMPYAYPKVASLIRFLSID